MKNWWFLTALVSLTAFSPSALACTLPGPPPPPLASVPPRTVSTMRVQILSIKHPQGYQAPIFAKVRVLRVYRGKKPVANTMLFQLPPCSDAAVNVLPGADLVIYSAAQPTKLMRGDRPNQIGIWNSLWVDYARARRFDPRVR